MQEKPLIHMVVKNETWFESIISDTFSMAGLIGAYYVNHKYLGSTFLFDTLIMMLFFAYAFKCGGKNLFQANFQTINDAIKKLEELNKNAH